MTDLIRFDAYIEAHRAEFVHALEELCRQPYISAQGIGVAETARYVAGLLDGVGASGRLLETDGAPIVSGEVGAGPRTLLIYDHYDV